MEVLAHAKCPTSTENRAPYLEAIRTVAFTEDHHLIGIYKLLYPRFKLGLPAVILDGRHFSKVFPSACARQASVDGWRIKDTKPNSQSRSYLNSLFTTTLMCFGAVFTTKMPEALRVCSACRRRLVYARRQTSFAISCLSPGWVRSFIFTVFAVRSISYHWPHEVARPLGIPHATKQTQTRSRWRHMGAWRYAIREKTTLKLPF